MVQLVWSDITPADLDEVAALARACLAVDGGLPTLAQPGMVERMFGRGPGIVGRDATGEVVAVGGLLPGPGKHANVTGMVDPSVRGAGVGEDLLAWARSQLGDEPLRLTIENDSEVTQEFAHRAGLVRVFAETVMRHGLHDIPYVPLAESLVSVPWGPDTRAAFHAVWEQSFAERAGFVPMPVDQWVGWVESERDFLPADSRVVLDGGRAVGFVTVSTDWIEQVGVVHDWRGRGLGAHLMVRSLTALRHAGRPEAWLAVTEENRSAHALYASLGFADAGVRARYADAITVVD